MADKKRINLVQTFLLHEKSQFPSSYNNKCNRSFAQVIIIIKIVIDYFCEVLFVIAIDVCNWHQPWFYIRKVHGRGLLQLLHIAYWTSGSTSQSTKDTPLIWIIRRCHPICAWGIARRFAVIHFRPRPHSRSQYNFKCGDENVDIRECYKYLGLEFTDHLAYDATVKKVACNPLTEPFGLLITKVKLKGGVAFDCFVRLYDNLVWSIINYCASIWGTQSYPAIESVHNRACRFFLGVGLSALATAVWGDTSLWRLHADSTKRWQDSTPESHKCHKTELIIKFLSGWVGDQPQGHGNGQVVFKNGWRLHADSTKRWQDSTPESHKCQKTELIMKFLSGWVGDQRQGHGDGQVVFKNCCHFLI